LHVTAIFQGGDVALSLLRRSYVLPWSGTLPGAAHPTTLGSTIRLKSAWVDSECIASLSKMDLTKISNICKGLETVDRGLWQTETSDYYSALYHDGIIHDAMFVSGTKDFPLSNCPPRSTIAESALTTSSSSLAMMCCILLFYPAHKTTPTAQTSLSKISKPR
jgi:hypothetical protein